VSSCGLFAVAYPRVPGDTRAELRQLYSQLCHDETPMVRRAAAQRLGGFAGAVEKDLVTKELLPLFTDLTADGGCCGVPVLGALAFEREDGDGDGGRGRREWRRGLLARGVHGGGGAGPARVGSECAQRPRPPGRSPRTPKPAEQDSVRLLAVESCGAFAAALSSDSCRTSMLPVVQKFAADKSWRVRYNVAQQLVALCEALGAETTRCAGGGVAGGSDMALWQQACAGGSAGQPLRQRGQAGCGSRGGRPAAAATGTGAAKTLRRKQGLAAAAG
jgi:serine/threonine-protein phosphatase 2A regulatory subunit A